MGWDELRLQRYERMVQEGIIPEGTRLPPRNSELAHDVAPWDDLDPRQQELFAHYMAVYAGMVDNIDQNVGRLMDALEELGQLDNTIIIFTSDNGASREGEEWGTSSYYTHLMGEPEWESDHARLDLIGGPQTIPHFPRGWAMACNTPFRLYKINTHAGGHQVPFIISWPDGIGDAGSMRRQYTFVTDLYPSLMEMCGIEAPTERNGKPLKPLTGSSIVPTISDPDAAPVHTEQYYEMWGHRGYYRDGWEIVTIHQGFTEFGDHEWELYDLTTDPTECTNLADTHPEKVAELAAAWEQAAWDHQVYPLEEGTNLKHIYRPEWVEQYEHPVTLAPGTPTLERWRSQRMLWGRGFTCTVDLDFAAGDEGVLVAHGDQGGGYLLSVEHDRLTFTHNDGHRMRRLDGGTLVPGTSRIVLEATAPGGNLWDFSLTVDGDERATGGGFPLFLSMAPFEGIDVGIDRRSPVDWEIYERHGPFPWTGTLEKVTYRPGTHAPDAPTRMIGLLEEMGAKFE
jgi:arylsulfatase